jgi:hypothetical protein
MTQNDNLDSTKPGMEGIQMQPKQLGYIEISFIIDKGVQKTAYTKKKRKL